MEIADQARRMAAARGGSASGIGAFLKGEARTRAKAALVTSTVACGFPSPADDYLDTPLDMNELLGIGLPSVFLVRVAGESMTGAGLYPGDYAVVNKAAEVKSGCIVVACLNGEFTLKRLEKRAGRVVLCPENPAFPEIEVPAEADFSVWGVVTGMSRVL
ncbi:LexA family protein [uncultured Enterovirga sp.]|uniref:LexA family protein n=1 Tax=uncultured Enterovirga sp. TaxID=2026352 RepID=UPI0035CB44B1